MEKLIKFALNELIYSINIEKITNLKDLYSICSSNKFIDFLEVIIKDIEFERLIELANEILEERRMENGILSSKEKREKLKKIIELERTANGERLKPYYLNYNIKMELNQGVTYEQTNTLRYNTRFFTTL